jgi:hypothetical protein
MIAWARRIPREYVLLGVLAFGLYLPGFRWGAPHASGPDRVQSWGVDDGTPLQPLADVHNIIQPKPDRNFGYPLMHSFVVTGAYAPYLGWLYLTGQFRPATGYPFGLTDPAGALRAMSAIAHWLSVLMGVGVVLAAYDAARALWDRRTAILAALFVLGMYPQFYYSRVGNPDNLQMFFTALALAGLARTMAAGFTVRRALWMGACIGFAAATKEQSAAMFVGFPLVIAALQFRPPGGMASGSFWKGAAAATLATVVAFGFGSGLFVDPGFYVAHLRFVQERVGTLASSGVAFVKSYPRTWEGHRDLAGVLTGYLAGNLTLPGLLLGIAGLGWTLWREPRKALLAVPAATYLFLLFWAARAGLLRYLIPPAFVLAFFAARAVCAAAESHSRAARVALGALATLAIGLGLLRGADLTHAMLNDSRYAAGEWFYQHAAPGDRLEHFGPSSTLPPLPPAMTNERAIGYFGAIYRPRVDQDAAREILEGWRARRPRFVIVMPDHSSPAGVPHSATCPPAVYRALEDGAAGYQLAATFHAAPLLPWARRPALDYPSVNPPIRIYQRAEASPAAAVPELAR